MKIFFQIREIMGSLMKSELSTVDNKNWASQEKECVSHYKKIPPCNNMRAPHNEKWTEYNDANLKLNEIYT